VKRAVDLAQARGPRSGERSALAQAASSRLGETTTEALGEFAGARLGEAISPEQDVLSVKIYFTRLGEALLLSPGQDEFA